MSTTGVGGLGERMKRLALTMMAMMAMTAVVAGLVAPVLADEAPTRFRPGDSWCERHAKTMVEAEVTEEIGVVVGAGSYLDRPVTSAYGCYDVEVGDQRRGELVSAWVDGEEGDTGVTCVKQSSPKSCKRTAVDLPVQGTTPLGHQGEPWWLHVLGLELGYGLDGGAVSIGAGGRPCVASTDECVTLRERRASAEPDIRYRARGYECAASDGSCARTDEGDGAGLAEQGGPLLAVDGTTVDAPDVCVELAVDPRC